MRITHSPFWPGAKLQTDAKKEKNNKKSKYKFVNNFIFFIFSHKQKIANPNFLNFLPIPSPQFSTLQAGNLQLKPKHRGSRAVFHVNWSNFAKFQARWVESVSISISRVWNLRSQCFVRLLLCEIEYVWIVLRKILVLFACLGTPFLILY